MYMMIEDMYNLHKAELERFARSIAGNEKEAEDLLQETFLRAIHHWNMLQTLTNHSRRAWLFKVMRNLLYDLRRRDRFVTSIPEGLDAVNEVDFVSGLEMERLLQNLPPKLHDIVHKRFILGMNSKQIADILGIPHATVRYRLHTALKLLKKVYNNNWEDWNT
ncbi:RNA polymerase sigma factor [Paenibacillus eucommiae]|uniref:RNA polymerase sigma-70 factor (ECF subfamily) n=1 Tax=Paenibacillus eucommiae TaxID=1355755 RepID=A0ABS4J5R2_9BACL|nr:RNA polymerase sigma factor [Paenibacillus eucommiae]MBP1994124.1 RNA polymerase sigma-70 factor (ECF subfamily) [Paenibacillus eucommiae]